MKCYQTFLECRWIRERVDAGHWKRDWLWGAGRRHCGDQCRRRRNWMCRSDCWPQVCTEPYYHEWSPSRFPKTMRDSTTKKKTQLPTYYSIQSHQLPISFISIISNQDQKSGFYSIIILINYVLSRSKIRISLLTMNY